MSNSRSEDCLPKLITVVFVTIALMFEIAVLHCFYQADIIRRNITHAPVDLRERDRRRWYASE